MASAPASWAMSQMALKSCIVPTMLEQRVKQTSRVRLPTRDLRSSISSSPVCGSIRHSFITAPNSANRRQQPILASWSWLVTMISSPGLSRGRDRLGQDVEIHGGGRAQRQLVRVAVEQAGHGPVAGFHGLAGLDGSLEGAVGLDLGILEKVVEAVD
jgi:hypothetical protein